jgi:tight adherence protein B
MSLLRDNLPAVLTAICVFALLGALWFVFITVYSMRRSKRDQAIVDRLGGLDSGQPQEARVLRLWHDGKAQSTVVRGKVKPKFTERLDLRCRDAGFKGGARSVLTAMVMASACAGTITFVLTRSVIAAPGVAAVITLAFWIYLQGRITKRAAVFETQFVAALDLAARSLRAGHPLLGAFQLISDELEEPVCLVFSDICKQHELGMSLEESVQRSAAASSSSELKLFATSVAVQLRSGGNLAEMMERLAEVIRERGRLARRVRVLTAQTQFSKRILVALPFLLFAILNLINPRYMDTLFATGAGQVLLGAGAVGLILGIITMNRMAVIKY